MIGRLAAGLVVWLALVAPADGATYSGTLTFRGLEASGLTVRLSGAQAVVALDVVHVQRSGTRIRFSVPGRPALAFDLRLRGRELTGSVRHGTLRGAVSALVGTGPDAQLGLFETPTGPIDVVRFTRFGSPEPFAVDLSSGAFGAAAVGTRLAVRQLEVRIPAPGATLGGTLTLPAGPGPFPAAVYVSGSGRTLRDEAQYLGGLLVAHGIAVLAFDKRGVGESGGRFPGSLASESTISVLAGDVLAAARFLAAQPEVDRARVGFFGLSQGGWIIPVAAVRAAGAVSWAVVESGPTVTQGESDTFADLARTGSIPEAEAEAHAQGSSGFDPAPWISQLAIPVLWLYGGADRNQPTDTSLAILRQLTGSHDFAYRLFPGAPHPLFDERGFSSGVFPAVVDWLRAHGLAA
jgi:uncharacterized protein